MNEPIGRTDVLQKLKTDLGHQENLPAVPVLAEPLSPSRAAKAELSQVRGEARERHEVENVKARPPKDSRGGGQFIPYSDSQDSGFAPNPDSTTCGSREETGDKILFTKRPSFVNKILDRGGEDSCENLSKCSTKEGLHPSSAALKSSTLEARPVPYCSSIFIYPELPGCLFDISQQRARNLVVP